MDNYRPEVSSKCPPAFLDLMKACWDADPVKRPDFVGAESATQGNVVRRLERMIYDLHHPRMQLAERASARDGQQQQRTSVAQPPRYA